LKKQFDTAGEVAFTYTLTGYDENTTAAIESLEISEVENGAKLRFRMHGQDMYVGEVRVWLDGNCTVEIGEDTVTLRTAVTENDALCFYYTVEDDLFEKDPKAIVDARFSAVKEIGFTGLYRENTAHWNAYFEEGYVKTGDAVADSTYRVALYHLKCFATRWSIPVGLNNCSWDGKFFAFDEYYCFLGLLGANRTALAKRVPSFRLNVCLDKAIERASKYTENMEQARFF